MEWSVVRCDGKPCTKSALTIKNATEQDSGLYNCSVYPYRTDNVTTLNIVVKRTYQLEVIGEFDLNYNNLKKIKKKIIKLYLTE